MGGNIQIGFFAELTHSRTFAIVLAVLLSVGALWLLWKGLVWCRCRALASLAYERTFGEDGVCAGESTTLIEVVHNRTFLPLFGVEIGFYLDDALVCDGVEPAERGPYYFVSRFFLPPFARITRTHTVRALRRGVFHPGAAEIYMGVKHDYLSFESPAVLYVYPQPLRQYPALAPTAEIAGERSTRRVYPEDPFAFSGIRPYASGDPLRALNARASARTGSWMVNRFDCAALPNVMIYLNLDLPREAGMTGAEVASLAELGLSCAADLAWRVISGGGRAGFAANVRYVPYRIGKSNRIAYLDFAPEGGKAALRMLLRSMAEADLLGAGASFAALLDRGLAMPAYDTDVYIFCFGDDDILRERVRRMERRARSVRVVVLHA